jgi:hypothetical protein
MVRGARQASKVYEDDGIEVDECCGRGVTYWTSNNRQVRMTQLQNRGSLDAGWVVSAAHHLRD